MKLHLLPLALTAAAVMLSAGLLTAAPTALAAATAVSGAGTTTSANGTIVDNSGTDTSAPGKEYALKPKIGSTAVQSVLGKFAGVLVGISGSLALLVFVWAGITLITAQGDAAKIRRARGMMTWTAVGLAVIFLAEPAVRLILSALLKGEVS